VRLQLNARGRLAIVACGAALTCGLAGGARAAEVEAAQRVTLFREPSSSNDGITVIHPQTDASVTLGSAVGFGAGYAVDIVSGATPRVFGGVDAVSTATKFSDNRHQLRSTLTYIRPVAEIAVTGTYAWEKDYRSAAVTVATRSDVLDHAFTLGLSYTHNFDSVCDQNNTAAAGSPLDRVALGSSEHCFKGMADVVSHRLHIDSLEPSITWAVTPRLQVQGGGTIQILDGFQANPYRRVALGTAGRTPQESLPQLRQRFAVFGRAAYAFPRTRTSLHLMGRLYRDTWAVEAISGEVAVNQYLAKFLILSVRGRLHAQRSAAFYIDGADFRTAPNGQYWTGDRELSPMGNYLIGGKLAYLRIPESQGRSFFNEIEAAAKWEGLFYRLESPNAPNADRKLALIWQLALSLRF
jgi:hypothetical protein